MPGDDMEPIHLAIHAIESAKALGAPVFTTPRDLCGSNPRLKLGFVAQVFNAKLGLEHEMEITAFATFINNVLTGNEGVAKLLPLDVLSNDLFERIGDGYLLAELLNVSSGTTLVPQSSLHKTAWSHGLSLNRKTENIKAVLSVAAANKYDTSVSEAVAIVCGSVKPVLRLLWSIVQRYLMGKITPRHSSVQFLRNPNESYRVWSKLTSEELLLRWIKKKVGCNEEAGDIDIASDPKWTCKLLQNLTTSGDKDVQFDLSADNLTLAAKAHQVARQAGIDIFTLPRDICSGSNKLTAAFHAQLFNSELSSKGILPVEVPEERCRDDILILHQLETEFARPLETKTDEGICEGLLTSGNIQECMEVPPVPSGPAVAFARYINILLGDQPQLQDYLPLDEFSDDLFVRSRDGLLFAHLISLHHEVSGLKNSLRVDRPIPDRWVGANENRQDRTHNLGLVLCSGMNAGFSFEQIDPALLSEGSEEAILDTLWVIVRNHVLAPIRTKGRPELRCLRQPGESFDSWSRLNPDEILLRWISYHLQLPEPISELEVSMMF
jgi:hypothetical protein